MKSTAGGRQQGAEPLLLSAGRLRQLLLCTRNGPDTWLLKRTAAESKHGKARLSRLAE